MPRLVDIVREPPFGSERTTIRGVLDREVKVVGYRYCASQFPDRLDYLAIEVELDGKRKWFATASSYIIDFFERVDPYSLPCKAKFSIYRDDEGHRHYIVS